MSRVLAQLDKSSAKAPLSKINSISIDHFASMKDLVSYLFKAANSEEDVDHSTVIVVENTSHPPQDNIGNLDSLTCDEKALLIEYFFSYRNPIVVNVDQLSDPKILHAINVAIDRANALVSKRITRVGVWTGVGDDTVGDGFSSKDRSMFRVKDIVASMTSTLGFAVNISDSTVTKLSVFKDMIVKEIDFFSLLSDNDPQHLAKLCHLVGHWSFPAPELSNDDLVYCAYLMLSYALDQVKEVFEDISTPNELLGFVFMVRDSYRNGNPFHNFRHAVDVLQACLHYSIKLHCLPPFKQYETDPWADETVYMNGSRKPMKFTELTASRNVTHSEPLLTSLETLCLLVSAIGHDVGHPGVTNAFLSKYSAPSSKVYNERSVLESFHTSVFVNKVLSVSWPQLLDLSPYKVEDGTSLNSLISTCILATDMAEHFEYVERLNSLKNDNKRTINVCLLSSLLIKCADISNVTRPLRVSSQWSVLLSREFEEVSVLEKKLSHQLKSEEELDVHYSRVPSHVKDVVQLYKGISKGQLFFISTFAESLFNSIPDLLPELKFTSDIIKENKQFWRNNP